MLTLHYLLFLSQQMANIDSRNTIVLTGLPHESGEKGEARGEEQNEAQEMAGREERDSEAKGNV